jgi:sigma-B regulation protein RsbU (phosphoserine phosphatase)
MGTNPNLQRRSRGSAPAKTFYRRLEALLQPLHETHRGEPFLAHALVELFEAFSADFGLTGAALFVKRELNLVPVAKAGRAPAFLAQATSIQSPQVSKAQVVFPDLDDLPESSTAYFVIELSRGPCVFVFAFDPDTDRRETEFFLNTTASILSLRILEEQFGDTLREAAEIQQSLLPEAAPAFDGFDIAARSVPASEVGGDWYDFLPLDEGSLGLAIGDASGHGLPAALMARDVVIGMRMGIEREMKAGYVLSKLNRVIHASLLSSRFVSLFYGELEENGSFFYFNAGHHPALLVDATGCTALESGDPVLGPLPSVRFRRRFAHLDRGAMLALYTDGVIEQRSANGELFGVDRLRKILSDGLDRPAAKTVKRCFAEVERFGTADVERDDATLVIVRRLASR